MISIGRGIRWYNNYTNEVGFSIENGFDFMQIWFKNGDIMLDNIPEPKADYIKKVGFPVIIHAVLKPEEINLYGKELLDLTEFLGNNEVIIHPVCDKNNMSENIETELAEQSLIFSSLASSRGITWYLENNSIIDKFHYTKEELSVVYSKDKYVKQLLDIAHIDNYQHLKEIVDVKFPECIHVAGKHFTVPHEHLPLTQGDIDYKLVFSKYLKGYTGRIILEVDGSDTEIIESKKIIEESISIYVGQTK